MTRITTFGVLSRVKQLFFFIKIVGARSVTSTVFNVEYQTITVTVNVLVIWLIALYSLCRSVKRYEPSRNLGATTEQALCTDRTGKTRLRPVAFSSDLCWAEPDRLLFKTDFSKLDRIFYYIEPDWYKRPHRNNQYFSFRPDRVPPILLSYQRRIQANF